MTTTPGRRLHLIAAAPLETDQAARELAGLTVPYGPVGHSSVGPVTFGPGSIRVPAQVGRVKLLEQHDPERPLGHALELTDTTEGLRGRFTVAAGAAGDEALAMNADGRRDGLSVGVLLDADVYEEIARKWWDGDDTPTAATGELLEVSHVTIPAFADARTDGSAALAAALDTAPHSAAVLVTFGAPQAPALAGDTIRKDTSMDTDELTKESASAATLEASTPPAAPAPNPARSGAATSSTTTEDRALYSFDGRGHSMIRDAYRARFEPLEHAEAAARFARFNALMRAANPAQVRALVAAVETRTTAPNYINEAYRPDMLVEVIDKGRPIVAALGTVNLTDATPYRLPIEGEFSGVADHTEGTAHAPEGDLSLGDDLVQPGAISGAYRLTRELIDASNPALDKIAVKAMARDYRRKTESKAHTAIKLAAPASAVATTTVAGASLAIDEFFDANDEQPDFFFSGKTFYATLRADVDGTGRPMLARVGSTNANGTITPGATGAEVDGVHITRSYSVDAAAAYLVGEDAVHLAESTLSTFRFEEVEGPGVVKLALWAYFAAKVIRPAGVVRLATTDETP